MRKNIGLFKAKREDNDDWIKGNFLEKNGKFYIVKHFTVPFGFKIKSEKFRKIKPETLCECTGLKDKNGKLIFEGDIVNKKYDDWECNCEVVFGNYSIGRDDWGIEHITQGFALKFDDGSGYCGLGEKNKYKVIGNKFDNKEFLGEKL